MTEITLNSLYNKLKNIKLSGSTCLYSYEKCQHLYPLIAEINHLKKKKNALILAHSYVAPEIIHGVSDFSGDSYELSQKAKESNADIIIFAAVKFMAETAKILNPSKEVYIPSKHNGCSLADSITEEDIQNLKKQYPEHTFVCYINTTAAIKAHCDVCVTSSNAVKIIKNITNNKIYFLPDKLMAKNIIQKLKDDNINKTIDYWHGSCYVHEDYDPEMTQYIKQEYPHAKIAAHPECKPEVAQQAHFLGSTSQMINFVKESKENTFFLLTECGLNTRLQLELPQKKFIGSCTLCQYMKANSLDSILNCLKQPSNEQLIKIDDITQKQAKACIEAMFKLNH